MKKTNDIFYEKALEMYTTSLLHGASVAEVGCNDDGLPVITVHAPVFRDDIQGWLEANDEETPWKNSN